jgi:hypothetical protein
MGSSMEESQRLALGTYRSWAQLNTDLLVNIRNYLGHKLGLKIIIRTEISEALNTPELLRAFTFAMLSNVYTNKVTSR